MPCALTCPWRHPADRRLHRLVGGRAMVADLRLCSSPGDLPGALSDGGLLCACPPSLLCRRARPWSRARQRHRPRGRMPRRRVHAARAARPRRRSACSGACPASPTTTRATKIDRDPSVDPGRASCMHGCLLRLARRAAAQCAATAPSQEQARPVDRAIARTRNPPQVRGREIADERHCPVSPDAALVQVSRTREAGVDAGERRGQQPSPANVFCP